MSEEPLQSQLLKLLRSWAAKRLELLKSVALSWTQRFVSAARAARQAVRALAARCIAGALLPLNRHLDRLKKK